MHYKFQNCILYYSLLLFLQLQTVWTSPLQAMVRCRWPQLPWDHWPHTLVTMAMCWWVLPSVCVRIMALGVKMSLCVRVSNRMTVSPLLSVLSFLLSSVVDCGSLSHPTNGLVMFSMSTFGAMATYMCDEGFNLIGNSTQLCLANGSWEGTVPTCQSKIYCIHAYGYT